MHDGSELAAIKDEKLTIKQEDYPTIKQEREEAYAKLWSEFQSDPDEEEPERIEKPGDWDISCAHGRWSPRRWNEGQSDRDQR